MLLIPLLLLYVNFPVAYLIAKTLQFFWFLVWAPWSVMFTFLKYPNFQLSSLSIANSLIFALCANRLVEWHNRKKSASIMRNPVDLNQVKK